MLGTEFDETLGKVAIPDVMNIKVKRQTNSNADPTLRVLLIVLLGGDVRNRI